jgi:hypothetical protein
MLYALVRVLNSVPDAFREMFDREGQNLQLIFALAKTCLRVVTVAREAPETVSEIADMFRFVCALYSEVVSHE